MEKKLLVLKRKKARKLHDKGWSSRKISHYLLASKNSVQKWIKMNENLISTDNRGWKKGKLRKYTQEAKEQIIQIRKDSRNIFAIDFKEKCYCKNF